MNTNNITPQTTANHAAATEIKKHRFTIFALILLGIATLAFAGCGQSSDSAAERATRDAIIRFHNATGEWPRMVDHLDNRYIPLDKNFQAITPEEKSFCSQFQQKMLTAPTSVTTKFAEEGAKQGLLFRRVLKDVQASNGK